VTITDVDPGGALELGGASPVEFVHGAPTALSDIVVEWDLDNDGDYDEAVEDVTAYLIAGETLAGRDWPSHLTGKAGPGQLRMTLLNTDDRFSYHQASSPLNASPFSLRTGRRVRVRTADSTPVDPVLLARDRFNRSDASSLVAAETGQAWTDQLNSGFDLAGRTAVASPAGAVSANTVATLDVGETDHYVQGTLPAFPSQHSVGVVARWEDSSNYIRAYMSGAFHVVLAETVGGTASLIEQKLHSPSPGMTIGLGVSGTDVTVYLAGVPVMTATTTLTDGTEVGVYGFKGPNTDLLPAVDDFHVWDRVAEPFEGCLWTGVVSDVKDDPRLGGPKVVTVEGEGVLAQAATDIQAPRVFREGNLAGLLAAEALARAGLCNPPQPASMHEGTVTLGPVGVNDGSALSIARQAEETERGFLHETNEGHPAFHDAAARAAASSQAWFSDVPGVGQFGYHQLEPLDARREVINRVTAGVAPAAPTLSGFFVRTDNTVLGGTSHCDVLMPTTAEGQLLVVFIRRAAQASNVNWLSPIWWIAHRHEDPDARRTRVYSRHCDGTESGTTVRFYTDSGGAGGAWVAHIYLVDDWYRATQGLAMAKFTGGRNPAQLDHGWGRVATMYIACYTGSHGAGTGSVVGTTFPDEYGFGQTNAQTTTGGDVFVSTAHKFDVVDAENAGPFAGDDDFALVESTVFAIRGYNGEHEALPTIKNPNRFGPSPGRFVTVDDHDSQADHNAIRSHRNAPNLFETEAAAQAYGEGVVTTYGDDRPILSLSFYASKNEAYRQQAVRRRVGDKITVTADGTTGLGIATSDFFVESINHRWTKGDTLWETTWELSPA
jgi:hypothetical protein